MPTVTFDISEETLAKIHNISDTSEISVSSAVEFLIDSALPDTPDSGSEYSDALRDATLGILNDGITTETLQRFGVAYSRWFTESCEAKTSGEIFQEAFDLEAPKGEW